MTLPRIPDRQGGNRMGYTMAGFVLTLAVLCLMENM